MSTRFGCGRPVACGRCSGCGCCDLADRRNGAILRVPPTPRPGRYWHCWTVEPVVHRYPRHPQFVAVGLLARRGAATLPHMVARRLAVPFFVITVVLAATLGVAGAASAGQ